MTATFKKWESKVIASRVAEFEQPPAPPQAPTSYAPQPTNNNRRSPHMNYTVPPGAHPPPSHYAGVPHVKTEAIDRPYIPMTQPMHHYVMPPMTAPPMPPRPGQGVLVLPRGAPPAAAATSGPPRFPTGSSGSGGRIPQLDGPSGAPPTNSQQIVQLDGPSSSESESSSPPPPDSKIASGSAPRPADTEEINSDLDDSESDADADEDPTATGGADTDIVFCTYDKVGSDLPGTLFAVFNRRFK